MWFLLDQVILSHIQSLFGTGKVVLRPETVDVYRYYITGFKVMSNVRNYFDAFPLLTKKSMSWSEIHTFVSNKEHLSSEGLAYVRVLQKEINLNNGSALVSSKSFLKYG